MRASPLRLTTLLVVLSVFVPNLDAQERRPMTVDDALDMVSVGSPLVSPDGSWVLYSRRTLDWDENEYKTEYWRVSSEGGEPYRFIGEDGGSGFQFSPNGTYLTFRRAVGEGQSRTQQLWVMRATGGEAVDAARRAGYRVIGVELAHGATPLPELELVGDICLVLGHEDRGLSREVLESCDELSYIPQLGRIGSLNVASAAAIVLYETRRHNW